MNYQLILALLFTILPITELRVGMPLAVEYAISNNVSLIPIFLLVIFVNILLIFFLFWFLDNLHKGFMNFRLYNKFFNFYLKKIQKKTDKFEKQYTSLGIIALMLFVAIPLPGTGAWTGCILAWVLGLERKKSIIAISAGVLIAGLIVFLVSLGAFSLF